MVVRKKAPTAKTTQSESTVNAARRAGAEIVTEKKFTAAQVGWRRGEGRGWGVLYLVGCCQARMRCLSIHQLPALTHLALPPPCGHHPTRAPHRQSQNKAGGAGANMAKLDNETEELSHTHVSSELKKQISQARLAKKLTQAQLGQMINEKPQIIQEYESGKAIPNPQVISKLSRALGVPLSNKGSKPKPKPKK